MRIEELLGRRSGKLVAVGPGKRRPTARYIYVACACDCGGAKEVSFWSFKYGVTRSCGCLTKERARTVLKKLATTHGKTNTPEFKAWQNMKKRCSNPSHPQYPNYGGRGITISEEWVNSFEQFLTDVGMRPSAKHSLDRADNEKGYFKTNCRWSTQGEQNRNKRDNRWVEIDGERLTLRDWADRFQTSYDTIYSRMGKGLSPLQALMHKKGEPIRG